MMSLISKLLFFITFACFHIRVSFAYDQTLLQFLKRLKNQISSKKNQILDLLLHVDPRVTSSLIYKEVYEAAETSNLKSQLFDEKPVQIFRYDVFPGMVGNSLGNYFASVACAHVTGMHFVSIKERHDNNNFHRVFPMIIPHENPLPDNQHELYQKTISEKCTCEMFCWRAGQPWEKIIPFIRDTMRRALDTQLVVSSGGVFPQYSGFELSTETDTFTVPAKTFLPLFPDVAIHFRCSGNNQTYCLHISQVPLLFLYGAFFSVVICPISS